MPDDFIPSICSNCNRAFNVANPLVKLDGMAAICPHCGHRTEVDDSTMQRARASRGETSS